MTQGGIFVPTRDGKYILPRAKLIQASEGEPAVQPRFERLGVLVVDDDRRGRILMQLGLEQNGVDVWLAADGCEALHLYQEHLNQIAVVLLDFRMPGLDAFATLDALREVKLQVPICFMSGDTAVCDPQALIRRGASYVIAKPFPVNDLVGLLRSLARGVPVGPIPAGNVVNAARVREIRGVARQP
jgi:CheY-like chemotaxis protein